MKKITILLLLFFSLSLYGCGSTEATKTFDEAVSFSNLGDEKSQEEVRAFLAGSLEKEDIERFLSHVKDYNETVEYTNLVGAFQKGPLPEAYDVERLDTLWTEKKGDFIGTNCRLNTYMLLKSKLAIPKGQADDSLLFFDSNAISLGKVLDSEETPLFKVLFSKVATEPTKEVKVHAKKMEAYLSKITFDEKARMLAVVVHDNLDGDFLFIGHVGVLFEKEGEYLFLEKLSFQEPYQAIKFKTKEACYNYLYERYKHYTDETTSKPFIMDNGKFVALEAYNT